MSDGQWKVAIEGLKRFLEAGHGAEAERLGWPHDELFAVLPVWSRGDLTGVGLAVGDREVTSITSSAIRIKTASGATLSFYRRPATDFAPCSNPAASSSRATLAERRRDYGLESGRSESLRESTLLTSRQRSERWTPSSQEKGIDHDRDREMDALRRSPQGLDLR